MRHRRLTTLRFLPILCALTACGGAVPTNQSASARPTSIPAATAPVPTRVAAREPTPETHNPAASPSAPSGQERPTLTPGAPSAVPDNASALPIDSPTATPEFPSQAITAGNADQLRLLRTIGYGRAIKAAIAPDNSMLAVATSGGLAFFELATLRELRFDRSAGGAVAVSWSDDGATVDVTLGQTYAPQRVERRRVADGSLLAVLDEHPGIPTPVVDENGYVLQNSPADVFQARFNPLDALPNPGVTITRLADKAPIYQDSTTMSVGFGKDNARAALVSLDGTLTVLDLGSGATVKRAALPGIVGATFSPDGQTLVTSGDTLTVWDAVSGAQLASQPIPDLYGSPYRQRVRFSADGSLVTIDGLYLVFEAARRRASTWRLSGAEYQHAWDTPIVDIGVGGGYMLGAVSPASQATASTMGGQTLTIAADPTSPISTTVDVPITALEFSADGAILAIGNEQGLIKLMEGDAPRQSLKGQGAVTAISFSSDGALVAAEFQGGEILVWRIGADEPIARIAPADGGEEAFGAGAAGGRLVFAEDSDLLLVPGPAGLRIYALSTGELLRLVPGEASSAAIGPRRRALAIVRDGVVEIWGI